jgi:nitrogen fixation protein NifB
LLAETIHDCRALLCASAGLTPRALLSGKGVRVVLMEGLIEEGLAAVYQGVEIRAPLRRKHQCGVGASCSGDGAGCG